MGDKLGYRIGISGTHPTALPDEQNFVNNESYNWVVDQLHYYAKRNITFALHIHIAVPNAETAIHVTNSLRQWVAPLLALSTNSPFYSGKLTNFKSARTMQFGAFPRTNIPPYFAGFNVSCVGDDRAYSYLPSRNGNTISDLIAKHVLKWTDKSFIEYSWLDRGSDERQYCAPGVDLPIASIMRSKYHEYPEYHTSADDFSVVTENGLNGSLEIMKSIVDAFELGLNPLVRTFCEPQLGKRGLYPNLSQKTTNERHPAQTRMDIIAYCNGSNTIFDICKLTGLSLKEVINEIHTLLLNGLLINTSHN